MGKPRSSGKRAAQVREGLERIGKGVGERRERTSSHTVLRIPINDAPFRVETDCSQFAMGHVLSQYINGKWHPVAYRSQALTAAERNYKIYDREMLAIMEALEDWRQYLLGAKHRVEVWTDHLNLTYFRQAQKLNRHQARWNTDLQPYDLKMVHKPGAMMKKTDILSQLAQFRAGDDDNRDIVLLPGSLCCPSLSLTLHRRTSPSFALPINTKIYLCRRLCTTRHQDGWTRRASSPSRSACTSPRALPCEERSYVRTTTCPRQDTRDTTRHSSWSPGTTTGQG